MNLLIIEKWLHHKNHLGLQLMLQYILQNNNISYKYGTVSDLNPEYVDIVYSPATPINTGIYPTIKFIFGPHFSVFPNKMLGIINNIHKNCIYIQPSEWCVDIWKNMGVEQILPLKTMSFPVNTDLFKPVVDSPEKKNKVVIYFKRRKESELNMLENYLREWKIQYELFNYVKKYEEKNYLKTLQHAKFGIVLGAHESQGFAIEEALSCNVPLIVWNATNMNQEFGVNHPSLPATSIPYWDDRCGEYFTKWEDWESCFHKFLKNIKTGKKYKPREFIMENLSTEPCAERFMNLITADF